MKLSARNSLIWSKDCTIKQKPIIVTFIPVSNEVIEYLFKENNDMLTNKT